jgi:serine/threonine protein kinase
MWALGIILYQLVGSYNLPFPWKNEFDLSIAIRDNDPDLASLPPTVSPFIKDTIRALLNKNPESRLDAEALVN